MPIEEVIKELKRLTESLEEIAKEEPNVEIDFDVADGEYWIKWFGELEKTKYGYQIKCESYC